MHLTLWVEKQGGKEPTFQPVRRLLRDRDAHQPCLLISTAVSWASSTLQALGTLGTMSWDGHSHLMSRWLHPPCLISPFRSSVQLSLLSRILYCSSQRRLQSWRLQCYFSLFCSLSTLPRHSWVMMPVTSTPVTGLHSPPRTVVPIFGRDKCMNKLSYLSPSLVSS